MLPICLVPSEWKVGKWKTTTPKLEAGTWLEQENSILWWLHGESNTPFHDPNPFIFLLTWQPHLCDDKVAEWLGRIYFKPPPLSPLLSAGWFCVSLIQRFKNRTQRKKSWAEQTDAAELKARFPPCFRVKAAFLCVSADCVKINGNRDRVITQWVMTAGTCKQESI